MFRRCEPGHTLVHTESTSTSLTNEKKDLYSRSLTELDVLELSVFDALVNLIDTSALSLLLYAPWYTMTHTTTMLHRLADNPQ